MNEKYIIDQEFFFKNDIYEISSISIERNYDINSSTIEGEFIVSGNYRLHEISINKEDFSFKIPFNHEIRSNINLDSLSVEITDFTYDFINENELDVHIEYEIEGDESLISFEDEKSLDEFLDSNEVEVVDLNEEDELREENGSESMIINNINSDNTYVKYHVHTVVMEDSIESICTKYNVNLNTLKKYNTFDNLELNMKLIIPENEEC